MIRTLLSIAILAFWSVAAYAECPDKVDFKDAPAVTPADLGDPDILAERFRKRAQATQAYSEQCELKQFTLRLQ